MVLVPFPHHAGLDAKQEPNIKMFLMEDVEVVATIALGWGIDKPDVRFV
jgi:superfamily II DNA helicase RecQ